MDMSYEMLRTLHEHVKDAGSAYYRRYLNKPLRPSKHILRGPAPLQSNLHKECVFCRLESLGQQMPLWLILQLSALLDPDDPNRRLTVSKDAKDQWGNTLRGAANALHSLPPSGTDDQWLCVELLPHHHHDGTDSGGGGGGGDVDMTD